MQFCYYIFKHYAKPGLYEFQKYDVSNQILRSGSFRDFQRSESLLFNQLLFVQPYGVSKRFVLSVEKLTGSQS